MFPISEDTPRRITPVLSRGIIVACVVVFLWQFSLGREGQIAAVYAFGLIPARLFGVAEVDPALTMVPAWVTIFTSMFMHGGFLHLGGNMLFLWVFGDNIEDAMGHARFLIFYLVCGTAAAVGHSMLAPASTVPMIGASGAISGILGAYLLLYPRATVRVLVIIILFITIIHVPAVVVLGLWFVGQLLSAAATPPDQPGIAFWAHIIGFLAGMLLVPVFKRSDVPLLQPPRHRYWERERRRGPWG
jgi:membrane associated rhomboid family serine protease